MPKIFAALALTTFAFSAASAADNPLAPAFSNTLVVKSADGEVTKLRLKEDGTYTGENPEGEAFTGTWSLKANNTKFCWKNNEAPKAKPWKQKDFDSKQEVTIEIVPGT